MNKLANQDGFTIIEVIIAMGIFAIGFLAVAAMQVNANMKTYTSRDITEAMELADAQVELLHGLPLYDDTLDLNGAGGVEQFDMPPELIDGFHTIAVGPYTIQWTVTPDVPLAALSPNPYSTTGPDPLTISKTVMVQIFETRNLNRTMAEYEMVKIWDKDG